MKKILLPTDFSNNSWNAIKYALQLFKNENCNFILLNTYTPIIYQFEYAYTSSAEFGLLDAMKETSQKGLKKLQETIETVFPNPKHTFTQISSFNTLINEINELSKGDIMDFIVMGTKGATGAKEVLFGSNTVHVLKDAKCPVLAIPDDFEFEKPHEVLFPSDYKIAFNDNQIKPVVELSKQYNSRVNILHVFYSEKLTEAQEENRKKLDNYFKGTAYLFHNVENKNIPQAIAEFQLKARINLLVMINNKHSFFENLFFKSTIKQIGFHLNIPFLVIPSKL